jgi:Flp pilus assembly protein TadD
LIYILVLFGSFFGICAILGARVAFKNRNVRKFVRGISKRSEKAKERGLTMKETRIDKPHKNPRVSAIEMQKVRTLLREAEKSTARRKYDETEKLLIQALTLSPESVEVRAELAKLYLTMERDPKAEALYRELLLDADEVSFHANLGLACYKQGKFEHACVSYQEALNRDPKSPERAAALGRCCMAAKRFLEAADLLEKASERLSRDTEILHMIGECYEQLGDLRSAEDAYMRIHRLQPYDEAVKQKLNALAGV